MATLEKLPYVIPKSPRIERLIAHLYAKMPEIEPYRAELITESYKATEGLPIIRRRSAAFRHILEGLPIVIRPEELIVGANSVAPRGCQTYPEYSFEWLDAELDTVATREADPFYISEDTKQRLRTLHPYWKGKTNSDLAAANMDPHALDVFLNHGVFTVGNYFYNGVGHLCVDYARVLREGYSGIKAEAEERLGDLVVASSDYCDRRNFLMAVIESCEAVICYAERYSKLALDMAQKEKNAQRKAELEEIARVCAKVPKEGATSFREACQAFWFVQQLLQMESSGHSISPGRFDQYMYPYYERDLNAGKITPEQAQELIDCIWVKLNDLNKVRDAASAEGFAGYGLFQNLIVGGQFPHGGDATNPLSFMCLEASIHVKLPQPSLSIRVWQNTPHDLMIKAASVTREGLGVPAYYNDEIIIPAIMARGLALEEARDYCIIGCVEPQIAAKTDGWHDAAFFNMCRPLELVFSNGVDKGKQIGPKTGVLTDFKTFELFYRAYCIQEAAMIALMVNAINAIDAAHGTRVPLPFQSSMVEDCMAKGKSVQEGGAHYNFSGPQGFGIANMTDALWAIRRLVYEQKRYTLCDFKEALSLNFGKGFPKKVALEMTVAAVAKMALEGKTPSENDIKAIYNRLVTDSGATKEQKEKFEGMLRHIDSLEKYGNDIEDIDLFAREVAYSYTKEVERYKNHRGGVFQAGLYPVSANVPLGAQTGATPDGRLAYTPLADGVGPMSGRDKKGPTAAANSVAKLDHANASNGTLFNQKFHPNALSGMQGLAKFAALVQGFFDQKGMHMQFNVVSRETLLDAQKHPQKYASLVVRVAGYSALFTTLSKSLQDDIIARTEHAWNR
ncbi:MAG: glycyl radical protein [Clostridia bacterium]|nr:glycyl radical protein [Clostridia bacterium]